VIVINSVALPPENKAILIPHFLCLAWNYSMKQRVAIFRRYNIRALNLWTLNISPRMLAYIGLGVPWQFSCRLNERPRKTLIYGTPAERFKACVASIG
jgi:hypothetical protein